jgi:hypothetical protein
MKRNRYYKVQIEMTAGMTKAAVIGQKDAYERPPDRYKFSSVIERGVYTLWFDTLEEAHAAVNAALDD